MWLKNTNEPTSRLYSPWMEDYLDDGDDGDPAVEQLPGDERGVVFDGPIQVSREIGEELIERFDDIEEHDSDN